MSNIKEISDHTKTLLETEHPLFNTKQKWCKYSNVCINHSDTENAKIKIETARQEAKKDGLDGILVLCGKKCHLGVSLKYCDIVIIMSDIKSHDMIYQMMYRCMTDAKDRNKKFGYVFDMDLNKNRYSKYIVNESMKYNNGNSTTNGVKYYIQNIIEIDEDDFEFEDEDDFEEFFYQ